MDEQQENQSQQSNSNEEAAENMEVGEKTDNMENGEKTAGTSEDPLVKEGDLLPGCSTFEDFVQAAYPVVMNGVKSSNNLPGQQQFSYFKTYSEFEEAMKKEGEKLQDVMQILLKYMGTKRPIREQPVKEKFDLIVDTNDKLLDRALKTMSQLDGTRFNPDEDFGETPEKNKHGQNLKKPISGSWNKNVLNTAEKKGQDKKENDSFSDQKLTAQQKTVKPQTLFKDKIDNSNATWVPRLTEKPNALKPLSVLLTRNDQGQEIYTHPYEYELDLWKPNEERLTMVHGPDMPRDLDETPLIFVQTEKELEHMVADLMQQNEFGVDLEHHSYRSFMGFTCLMQISTKETDYLIDTLKLRHKLYILNTVFTKPNILKIFHGAGSDIEWLQRDLSLYVVNMFDTFAAAKILEYPKLGLAFLLKQFCQVEANKKYQLYDWRIRPLPEKAKHYARQDTHYLIYIYQQMNNELYTKACGKTNLIEAVYNKSRDLCKRVYVKPILDENSHMKLYRRMQRPFDTRQLFALKEIYKWRDTLARKEDESPGYVLSNHMMMQIAQLLPREVQGILACCNPIPPLVRQYAVDIHKIILKAKEIPLIKSLPDESAKKSTEFSARDHAVQLRLSLYTHDNTGIELRDDLPTLFNGNIIDPGDPPEVEPKLAIMSVKNVNKEMDAVTKRVMKISFVSPYERYKRVLPYSIQQEKEQVELEQKREAELAERRNQMQNMSSPSQTSRKSPLKRQADLNDNSPLENDETTPGKKLRLSNQEEASVDFLLATIKQEVEDDKSKAEREKPKMDLSSSSPSVGVVGGEISVERPSNNSFRNNNRKKKNQNNRQEDFEPYNYSQVDFNRFHSGNTQQANKMSVSNPRAQNKGKRKQQFHGKQVPSKKRGQLW